MSGIVLSVEPFNFGGDGGIALSVEPVAKSGRWSTYFPTVYVAADEVEIGEDRYSREEAAAWFRAVADYLAANPS